MKLYGALASPYVMRVIMYARLKGVELERAPVPGDNPRSPEYHAINPLGKVPGLDLGDRIIPESGVICDYLDDLGPDRPGMPHDPLDRVTTRLVARITDLYISPRFRPLLPHLDPEHRDRNVVDEIAAGLDQAFRSLDYFMGDGPFCVGDAPTLGDCALGPYVQLLKNVIFPAFDEIPDPTAAPGRLASWWEALQTDALCKTTLDEYGAAVDEFMAANRATILQHR
ncbi:MAG: glutathione S-transferase family protein [Gammaproteobacteria bacterium]|nr:glutathione S-transferase family protein [Gammaproteobacteria bacterium]